jgi:uncharacterized protein (DUF58 family)
MTPTLRSVVLACAGIALAALPAAIDARLWPLWTAMNVLFLLALTFDALLIPGPKRLRGRVRAPHALLIGEIGTLSVSVSAGGEAPKVQVSALVELDDLFEPADEVRAVSGEGASVASIPITPRRRGTGRVKAVWLRLRGPLGLAEKRLRENVDREVAVLPDIRPVRAAALVSVGLANTATGAKATRFIGEGSDFAALRDYVPGFDHRAISWRASARHRRLLVREFRAERDQPVVLAFDTGRLMSEALGGTPRLDHAISAGLLLAWSCLKTGDRVGVFSFGARPGAFRAPDAGMQTFNAIREWTTRLDYGIDETNYTLALSHLSERLRRRALVVLMTDFVDVVAARLMIENVARLARRHLILFATLSDPAPARLLDARPRGIADVHRAAVAGQFLREREGVLSRLRRLGAHCIDSEPGELQAGLVQRYLWIKRRELL